MSPEDRAVDMFEMRTPLDATQGDSSEDLPESELQEYIMERSEEVVANYRIVQYEFNNPNKLISLEYFEDYADAVNMFNEMCDNEELVKAYGKFITIELSKAYPMEGTIHWEAVNRQMLYTS